MAGLGQRLRAAWQAFRAYEAAIATPARRPVIGANLSGDAATQQAYPRLREWGRYLDENHDLAVGILDELVKNIVGAGIVTIPKPMRTDGTIDEVLGSRLIERWRRWTRSTDVSGELHWHEAQRLICRAWMRDGEEFIQHVAGRDRYPFAAGDTPYRIELIESDLVPHDLHDEERGWRQGVRLDAWRRPTGYAVYLRHPGDLVHGFGVGLGASTFDSVKVVEAGNVTHLKCVKRWPQTRGVSVLHPVISRLYDIKDLEESERIKNRILASWTAAIKRSPDLPGYEESDATTGARYLQMSGGTIIDTLAPGEEITGVGPEYPNAELNEHLTDQIRRVAAGAGVRYSSISRRYDGNYAAQRQELVESEGHYKMREDVFVQRVCRVVYERWVLAELMSGATALAPGMDFERAAHAEFRGPVTPWIDPLKEVQADALAVAEGFATQEQIQIKRGASPEIIGREPVRRERAPLSVVGEDDDQEEDDAA